MFLFNSSYLWIGNNFWCLYAASDSEDDVKMPKLCRLCSESISHDPQFLFESREEDILLAEKVNTALPIHVRSISY